jgi:hypothetical protein
MSIAVEDLMDSIIETYPSGMTLADIEAELECHGRMNVIFIKPLARKIFNSCEPEDGRVDTTFAAFSISGELWDRDKEARRKEIVDQVGNASTVQLSNGDVSYYVHRSVRRPGKWQLSRVDQWGPSGHTDHDTFEYALYAAIGAHPDSYWNEGSSKYRLVAKAGER